MMDWSPEQEQAITKVQEWLENPGEQQVFLLSGYAGTGKTTLAKHLVEGIEGEVLYGAYTGKAALVLQQKGCAGACTIHSMIYIPREKSQERLAKLRVELNEETDQDRRRELAMIIEEEKENLSRPSFNLNLESAVRGAALVVLDEVSMVGTSVAEDILSFGTPVLALGDPAQLPPVGDAGYFTDHEPDILLTEIHRQAEGSPVLEIATAVRQGQEVEKGDLGGRTSVISKGVLSIHDLYNDHDQIIVGRNVTRRAINDQVRKKVLKITGHPPVAGDRLVCYRNNKEYGLMNGTQWIVDDVLAIDEDQMQLWIHSADSDTPYTFPVKAWMHRIEGREKEIPFYSISEAADFDYGYAITCHKSQGSQWPRIAVVDESGCFRKDARKWLYTAVTRAAESLTLIKS